jgi:hypothetical protein
MFTSGYRNKYYAKKFQVEQHYGTEYHVDRIPEVRV